MQDIAVKYSYKMISSLKAINIEIILAIDLKKGKVVRAFAGFRLNYKPLKIGNLDLSDPITLIQKTLKKFNLNKVYIADLDAIKNLNANNLLILKILKKFPKIDFLIDSGFYYPISIYNFKKKLKKKKISNFYIVLGTEKLKKYNLRVFGYKNRIYISLDILNENDKSTEFLKKSKFRLDVILMFLRNVGGRGIRFNEVKRIIKGLPDYNFHYAGGVRYFRDLRLLKNVGVESAIVSTLVHKHLGS